jgi:hypothetical protein
MSKRTIIIAALAILLFIAALFSLFMEKQDVTNELNELLNPGDKENKEAKLKNENNGGAGPGTEQIP